jgi:hypothetical protein
MRAGVTNDHAVVAQFAINARHDHRIAETQCGCQEPSWNENMKVFSDLAINSENISHDILTIDGLVRSAAVRIWPPYKFCRSFVDPAEGLPFVNPGAPRDRPTHAPAQRATPAPKYAPTLDVEVLTIDG